MRTPKDRRRRHNDPLDHRLSDGTRARKGMRVVFVREILISQGYSPTSHDNLVHEITELLPYVIELGPLQAGGSQLRRADKGAAVTCRHCAGWGVYMHWLRRTNEAQRKLREQTKNYRLFVRQHPQYSYEVGQYRGRILTKKWRTPEEAVAEALDIIAKSPLDEVPLATCHECRLTYPRGDGETCDYCNEDVCESCCGEHERKCRALSRAVCEQ